MSNELQKKKIGADWQWWPTGGGKGRETGNHSNCWLIRSHSHLLNTNPLSRKYFSSFSYTWHYTPINAPPAGCLSAHKWIHCKFKNVVIDWGQWNCNFHSVFSEDPTAVLVMLDQVIISVNWQLSKWKTRREGRIVGELSSLNSKQAVWITPFWGNNPIFGLL